jgi:hypothetical protein
MWKVEDDEAFQRKLEALLVESPISIECLVELTTALLISVLVSFKASGFPLKTLAEQEGSPLHVLVSTLKKLEVL